MKMTIIMGYRPTVLANKHNRSSVWQDENDMWWTNQELMKVGIPTEYLPYTGTSNNLLETCVKAIRKNSFYHHRIIIGHEPDVYFNEQYLERIKKQYDVEFMINPNPKSTNNQPSLCAMANIISTLPDDEMVLYAYSVDCVCGKNWDIPLKEAHDSYGDDVVYNAMWVEPRTNNYTHSSFCGPRYAEHQLRDLSAHSIWEVWRAGCRHSLAMQFPIDKEYMAESEFDNWSAICNSANKGIITEHCGTRDYGYWCLLIARNRIFKQHMNVLFQEGACDLRFEESLEKTKVIVTKSHVFHIHFPYQLDDIEVAHEI